MDLGLQFKDRRAGSAIRVRISPRASKNEISEILEEGIVKIRLNASPVEGQANKALIKFLSSVLDVPQSKIEIISGQKNRDKLVTIDGLPPETVTERIKAHLAS